MVWRSQGNFDNYHGGFKYPGYLCWLNIHLINSVLIEEDQPTYGLSLLRPKPNIKKKLQTFLIRPFHVSKILEKAHNIANYCEAKDTTVDQSESKKDQMTKF